MIRKQDILKAAMAALPAIQIAAATNKTKHPGSKKPKRKKK